MLNPILATKLPKTHLFHGCQILKILVTCYSKVLLLTPYCSKLLLFFYYFIPLSLSLSPYPFLSPSRVVGLCCGWVWLGCDGFLSIMGLCGGSWIVGWFLCRWAAVGFVIWYQWVLISVGFDWFRWVFFFFSGFWVHGLIRVALDASCGCGLIGVVERLVWVDWFGGGVLICKLWVVVMVVLGDFFLDVVGCNLLWLWWYGVW